MKKILEVNTQKYNSQLAKFENAVELWNKVKDEFLKIEIEPNPNEILNAENVFKYCVDLYWAKFGSQFPNTVTPTKALYLTDFQIIFVKDYVRQLKEFKEVYTFTDEQLICSIDKSKYDVYLDPAKEDEYNKTVKFLEMANDFLSFSDLYQLQRAVGNSRSLVENGIIKVNNSYFRI